MGFRTGAYATVWEVNPVKDSVTRLRISVSKKVRDSDEYEQCFGGYVSCLGTTCAAQAAKLNVRDRIKLKDIDVENRYDKEKNVTYTNFNIWSFEDANIDQAANAELDALEARSEPEAPEYPNNDNLPF